MSKEWDAFLEYIRKKPPGKFVPGLRFHPRHDICYFYDTDEPCYAEQINRVLTVYLSMETKKLIGFKIFGLKQLLDESEIDKMTT